MHDLLQRAYDHGWTSVNNVIAAAALVGAVMTFLIGVLNVPALIVSLCLFVLACLMFLASYLVKRSVERHPTAPLLNPYVPSKDDLDAQAELLEQMIHGPLRSARAYLLVQRKRRLAAQKDI